MVYLRSEPTRSDTNPKTTRAMKRHTTTITIIALLMALAGTVRAQQMVDGWKKIVTGAQGNLYDVCCIDADNIWVCAQDGGLLKSSDGGETWVRKHTEEGFAMSRIKFANADVGYAMGVREQSDMVLLRTDDAGETWTRVADTALDAVAIGRSEWRSGDWQLIGADTLYVFESMNNIGIGGHASLYRSTDGGHSFDNFYWELPYDSSAEHRSARAVGLYFEGNEGYCVYLCTDPMDIPMLRSFKTDDNGQTWTRHTFFVGLMDSWGDSYDIYPFVTARIHVLNGSEARLFYRWGYLDTQDGFDTISNWFEHPWLDAYSYTCNGDGPYDLKFTDDRHGCATCMGYIVVKSKDDPYIPDGYAVITNDGGETWELLSRGMESDREVFSVDGVDTTFYVTSENGVVYKRCLVELAAVDEEPMTTLTVGPTLTGGVVVISGVALREASAYNTLGQLVLTKKEEADTMTLDLSGQPSGLYFITVTDQNGQRCVRKVVKQ